MKDQSVEMTKFTIIDVKKKMEYLNYIKCADNL